MKKKKLRINWVQLFFFTLWFLAATLILVLHLTDSLDGNFMAPKAIAWLYDLLGVLVASIVQLVLSIIGIFTSFSRVEVEIKPN